MKMDLQDKEKIKQADAIVKRAGLLLKKMKNRTATPEEILEHDDLQTKVLDTLKIYREVFSNLVEKSKTAA
ncbi:MAG TPA: hypothetical protein VF296_02940 [Gallionella sp.]